MNRMKREIRSLGYRLRNVEKMFRKNGTSATQLKYCTSNKELKKAIRRNRLLELADVNAGF